MKKKVVCHISYHQAFDDRIYWKQLLTLKKCGYDVTHLVVADKDEDFYTSEGIRIISLKNKKLTENIYLNKLLQLFSKNSIRHRILKHALELKADIYQYHDLQLNAVVAQIKLLPQKPKIIYDAREAYFMLWQEEKYDNQALYLSHKFFNYVVSKWELKQASKVDLILTNDVYTFKYYQKNLPQVPCTTVFNYSYFLPKTNVPKKEKQFDFIYSGGIFPTRGIFEMVYAIKRLTSTFPNTSLLVIGSFFNDTLKKQIVDLIKAESLERNVIIKEAVPFAEINEYYEKSLIGLGLFHRTPKYTTFLPIKLFEYMAFGLPVIFSDFGPPSDIIKTINCGFLVNPLNNEDVANAMYKLLTDKSLYELMSLNGKKAVLEKYSWEYEKVKFIRLNEELIGEGSVTENDLNGIIR
jgi:glycosyltransferase involved in cell wall biosynthesis